MATGVLEARSPPTLSVHRPTPCQVIAHSAGANRSRSSTVLMGAISTLVNAVCLSCRGRNAPPCLYYDAPFLSISFAVSFFTFYVFFLLCRNE